MLEYLDKQGITTTPFEAKIGVGRGYLKQCAKNGTNLGMDTVVNFIHHFPDLDVRWLLTGDTLKGESRPDKKPISDSETYKMFLDYKEVQRNYEQSLKDLVNEKERMINEKERMINEKERTITLLLEAKNSTKQTASV